VTQLSHLIIAFFGTLQCLAVHSTNISSHLKNDILRAGSDDKKIAQKAMARVIREVRKKPSQRYLMGTSQAIDIINGGVKGTPVQCPRLPELMHCLRVCMQL
jgi:hypothetical protein